MTLSVHSSRPGSTLVAVLAAMTVVLLLLGGMLKIGLIGRRQLLKELDARQAECLLEAAADRAAQRLAADPAWSGDARTVAADQITGVGAASVTTSIAAGEGRGPALQIVVDYPAGRTDSVRRERTFPFTPPAAVRSPTSASPPTDPPSLEVSP